MTGSVQTTTLLQKISHIAVTGLIAILLLAGAWMKLSGDQTLVENFAKWGLSEYKTGVAIAEIGIVFLLIFRKTAIYGIILLSILMSGAIFIHIRFNEPFFLPAALLLVAAINYLFIRPASKNK